ncbi:MAG: hypothetical protein J7M38_05125 [Armatimonadetes bacterium]|nr:hypothetical protein [Armatimonadota bacterium]
MKGELLLLETGDVEYAKSLLQKREGMPTTRRIKRCRELEREHDQVGAIIYADLPCNINPLTVERLAALALASFTDCRQKAPRYRNGILYLRKNIEADIVTPLTPEYEAQVLRQSGTTSLEEAEALCLARISGEE